MPFKKVEHTSRTPSRVLNQGGPNMGKTHALRTWPRQVDGKGHAAYLAFPGEKGWETMPTNLPDLSVERWESSPAEKTSSAAVVAAVEKRVFELLATPDLVTFMGDGLHKYYDFVLDSVTGGAYFAGTEFEPREYARAHERFKFFLDRVLSTPTPYIVFTSWDGREADKPELKSASPTHIFPDFPGKMAKRIMGEFPVVVYSQIKYGPQGEIMGATWQLRPSGAVWGAAVKAPLEIIERLPVTIPQDFKALEQALQGAWDPKGGKK